MSDGPGGGRPDRRLLAGVLGVVLVATVLGVLLALDRDPGPPLPASVAGLPAAAGRDTDLVLLERSLRGDPAVSDVAGRVYDDGTTRAAVLLVLPTEPLTDRTAARLVDEVLQAAGDAAGAVSRTSEDGAALLACTGTDDPGAAEQPDGADAPAAAGAACVAVDASRAVVAVADDLPAGATTDPLGWLDSVRGDVLAAGEDG